MVMVNLGKLDHDRSLFSRSLESRVRWLDVGKSSPFMALSNLSFRLVNYDNLPSIVCQFVCFLMNNPSTFKNVLENDQY